MNVVNYIIPLCANVAQDDKAERLLNLNVILERFLGRQHYAKIRVILVEQILEKNGAPWFLPRAASPKDLEIVKIPVRYPVFVKGWLYNIGAKHADGKHIIFAECDCTSTQIDFCARLLAFVEQAHAQWAIGWGRLYYTLQSEKREFLKGGDLQFYRNNGIAPRQFKAEGGMVYSTKAFWQAMGGYSEWIIELGGPDNDWAFRARWWTGLYPYCRRNVAYHLYHPHIKVLERKTRIENRERLQYMYDNPKVVCRAFRKLAGKVGGKEPLCASVDYYHWARKG